MSSNGKYHLGMCGMIDDINLIALKIVILEECIIMVNIILRLCVRMLIKLCINGGLQNVKLNPQTLAISVMFCHLSPGAVLTHLS